MTDKEIVERAKEAEKRTGFGELVHSPISKGVNSAFGIGFIEGMVEYRNSLQEESVNNGLDLGNGVIWRDLKNVPAEGEFPYNKLSNTLECDIENVWKNLSVKGIFSSTKEGFREIAYHFSNWKREQYVKDIFNAKEDGYRLGKATMKRQMLDEAVDGRLVDDGGDMLLVVPSLPIITRKMDDGDKVKIIVVKEE